MHNQKNYSPVRRYEEGLTTNLQSHMVPVVAQPPPKIEAKVQQMNDINKCIRSLIKQRMFGGILNNHRKKLSASQLSNFKQRRISQKYSKDNIYSIKHRQLLQKSVNAEPKTRINSYAGNMLYEQTTKESKRYKLQRLKSFQSNKNYYMPGTQKVVKLFTNKSNKNNQSTINQYSLMQAQLINIKEKHTKNRYTISTIKKQKPKCQQTQSLYSPQNRSSLNFQKQISFISAIDNQQQQSVQNSIVKKKKPHFKLNNISSISKSIALPSIKSPEKKKNIISNVLSLDIWDMFAIKDNRNLELFGSQNQTDNIIGAVINFANFLLNKKCICRQTYYNFYKTVNEKLFSHVFSYFNIKIPDCMSKKRYEQQILQLSKKNNRSWSFLIFQFWDIDRNGIIDSADLFKVFNLLQNAQLTIEQRQKENKTNQQNLSKFQHPQLVQKHINHCKMLIIEEMNKLNNLILQNAKSIQFMSSGAAQKSFYDGQASTNLLQQSLLRNIDVKHQQINQIIETDQDNNNKKSYESKKQVLNISPDLNVKFSSCYRKSFLATEHNQQTRLYRQRIQYLRQNIKKQRKNRIIKNGSICYEQFIQINGYLTMKKTILELLGLSNYFQC